MKKLLFIAGARPNFMKIAPVIRAVKKTKIFKNVIVHTGQHYDDNMSRVFFQDLDIPKPNYFLGAGGGSHAWQTAKIMLSLEAVLKRENPALVIVVGDVNSTMAGAITAKKLGLKLAHIEAGLRSRDMSMPEEINRTVTDSIADIFFVTEKSGIKNLKAEGRKPDRIYLVGNVMIDSLFYALDKLKKRLHSRPNFGTTKLKDKLGEYVYLTMHRPSNVDDRKKLARLIKILAEVSRIFPVIYPIHPRAGKSLKTFGLKLPPGIHAVAPLSYMESLFLWKDARAVITDSGGLQEETTVLHKPCFTLRNNTERPVTVESGTNILVRDGQISALPGMLLRVKKGPASQVKKGSIPYRWDGRASLRISKILNTLVRRKLL